MDPEIGQTPKQSIKKLLRRSLRGPGLSRDPGGDLPHRLGLRSCRSRSFMLSVLRKILPAVMLCPPAVVGSRVQVLGGVWCGGLLPS